MLGLLTTYWNVSIRRSENKENDRIGISAENLIYAIVLWCGWLYAVTEILSIGKWINRMSIVIAWGIYLFVQCILLTVLRKKGREMSARKSRAFSFMEGQELRGADRSHSVHTVFDSCHWPGASYDSV